MGEGSSCQFFAMSEIQLLLIAFAFSIRGSEHAHLAVIVSSFHS